MKHIAVLSCGRSDLSIYLPLIKAFEACKNVELHLVAFGSHTSRYHGYSLENLKEAGSFKIIDVDAILGDDQSDSISISMGLTIIRLAEIWKRQKYDFVICLGDRHEMLAAVASAVPFNIPIAHIHGGEKTLGATDNRFRHAITALADLHFTSCDVHKRRVIEILDDEFSENVLNVGAIALQNLNDISLLSVEDFATQFSVDLSLPTVLVTYHPETEDPKNNERNVTSLISALSCIDYQIIITLPNNDVGSSYARQALIDFGASSSSVFASTTLVFKATTVLLNIVA